MSGLPVADDTRAVNVDDVLLSHPRDFFQLKHLPVIPGTCFVLMPFGDEFKIVYQKIEEALKGLMTCTRADDLVEGKPILERILRGIATAELIVADLTGRNPNVFYELGIAHTRTKNVLLFTQNRSELPFDLNHLFCHQYDLHSTEGLSQLVQTVREMANKIRNKTIPAMLDSPLARTKRIVAYMDQLLESPRKTRGLLVRTHASISSLGNTGRASSDRPGSEEYALCLTRERNRLIELLESGAGLQAIISPQILSPGAREPPQDRRDRLDRLINFLRRNDECINRCEFVVSPVEGSNLLFFGEEVLFEGHKTDLEKGFGWTVVHTDERHLSARLEIFDKFFESCRKYTHKAYGRDGAVEGEESLREAVIQAVELARDLCGKDRDG